MTGSDGLDQLAARLSGRAVLVLGDVMLDEYLWGDARSALPAGTPPVVKLSRRSAAPGGAANVAAGIVGLGGLVRLCGVVGADANGVRLAETLWDRGVATEGLIKVPGRPTTTKNRIVAAGAHVLRLDIEDTTPMSPATEATLGAWVEARFPGVGGAVVSDYGKGAVTAALARATIDAARRHGVPVVIDPKAADFAHYRGATLVTPTIHEAERACWIDIVDEASLTRAATSLMTQLEGGAVLITRGSDGMSLFAPHAEPVHIASEGGRALDATGAGDTVVEALALGLAAGGDLVEAARLATRAAAVVVSRFGTATVSLDDLTVAT
jgi:rfaE bifunctional protein kinase chain/domain